MSALGDVVQTLPLASALKRAWPDVRLTWAAQPLPARLLETSPVVDEVLRFERRRGLWALPQYRRARARVRGRRFDLVIVPQVAFKAGLLAGLLPAGARLGFDRSRASDLQWIFTTHRIPPGPRRHVVQEALEFARALGVPTRPLEWGLRLTPQERRERDAFVDSLGAPACGVVVASSDPRKNWPAERWVPVVEALEERWGFRVVLLGGPAPREREIADRIRARARQPPMEMLSGDVRRLLTLLAGCRLVLGPDTGPLHMAVALGVPVVGLYGRTNPNVTGPYGPSRELVADGYARHPGEEYGFSRRYRRGMRRITPAMVLERVRIAVARLANPAQPAAPPPPRPGAGS